jgi:hypothetical protein
MEKQVICFHVTTGNFISSKYVAAYLKVRPTVPQSTWLRTSKYVGVPESTWGVRVEMRKQSEGDLF